MEWTTGNRFSTYKQYKEDTETIAGWLAYNFRRCGHQIDEPTPASSTGVLTAPSRRLKGKARKQAREAPASPPKSLTRPQYTINVSDFGRMAKAIAEFNPKVNIPKALDNLFSRVINTRNQFTQWYQAYSHSDEGSNKSHAHFTSVLTNAWEILRPSEQARTSHVKKRIQEIPGSEPVVNLVNRFSALEVEELQEQGPDVEPGRSVELDENDYKLTDVARVTLLKSEEVIEEDFFFGIFTFMKELDDVRSSIRRSWRAYRQGVAELIMPSLLTNTAIQLVRRAEHELDLMIERPKNYPSSSYPVWNLPDIFIYATHEEDMVSKGQDLDSFLKPSPRCHVIDCSHGQLCLSDIYSALKHSLYETKSLGEYYVVPGDETLTNGATENFRRIKRMLPSFASDEITSGIGLMFRAGTIPISVAFGVQLLLDIQDKLQDMPDKPIHEVKKHTRNMLSAFRSKKLNQEPFVLVGQGSQWLATTLAAYELDVLGDNFRRKLLGGDELRGNPEVPEFVQEPDYFLRINPVKCGMLKYGLYQQPHNYGCRFEEAWRGITSMVHLYVAGRSLYPNDPVWPDMEYFLQNQDLDNMFVGGLPRTMEEAHKKFLLAAGVTATNFARNRRSTKPKLNMEMGRWASNPCLLDGVFSNWMCGGQVMTDDMILNLVRAIGDPEAIATKAKQVGLSPEVEERCREAWSNPDRRMTTILGNLGFYIISETSDLYFDWLSFAETCQKIWTQIRGILNLRAPDHAAHSMVIEILDQAQKCQWMAEVDKEDVTSSLRKNATGLVQSWGVIQKVCRKGMKVSSEKDNEQYKDARAWIGDKELFNVMSRTLDESSYPHLSPSLAQKVYKNWPVADKSTSAVIRMNNALPSFSLADT
ncbi:hypothetical protein F5Y00DRAFT_269426 [Daldinia vernicosa]|uniref:uncharacterized protein n=1 Tax=Daldinia vernicosa TaxID=114800 RepID=UPI0020076470|nr:uncharacterized protein F5Y00DRAFT_269426 [Daldinia vernicosa]KAI0849444.1 hypothetical protein F5Y00DRAFT_269426 [Daldinia vernicosa]